MPWMAGMYVPPGDSTTTEEEGIPVRAAMPCIVAFACHAFVLRCLALWLLLRHEMPLVAVRGTST